MRSSILLLLVLGTGLSAACESTVIDEDDAACEESSCAAECPSQQPEAGDGCDLRDFTECRYGIDCTKVYSCDPVYPEAGAPSEWSFVREEGHGCKDSCDAESCAPGDIQVATCPDNASCYEVSGCSGPILCAPGGCSDPPECDPGDPEVSDCPPDVSCYIAQACGGSILCADSTLPEHGCPTAPPEDGDPCAEPDQVYNYPTNNNCVEAHLCDVASEWHWIGSGCM